MDSDHGFVSWIRIMDSYHGFVSWICMMDSDHKVVSWIRIINLYYKFVSWNRIMHSYRGFVSRGFVLWNRTNIMRVLCWGNAYPNRSIAFTVRMCLQLILECLPFTLLVPLPLYVYCLLLFFYCFYIDRECVYSMQ